MNRCMFILFALVIALSLVLVPSAAADNQGKPLVVSKMGIAKVQGKDVIVDVLVVVPPGQNANEAAIEALRQQGARPFESAALGSEGFGVTGLFWEQLPEQYYNPSNEPIEGVTALALTKTQTTWNGVPASYFEISDGGVTNRSPSLVRESPGPQYFDGYNDVAWMRLGGNILGVTWYSTTIDEADMALNTRYPWSVDQTPGTYDVETVYLHENGHVVGLDHSTYETAVMYYMYNGIQRDIVPGSDDNEGVTYLYDDSKTGIVSGIVTDATDTPIQGAKVELEATPYYGYTDEDGHFSISNVPDPVTYTITATADDFEISSVRFTVEGTCTLNFELTPAGGGGGGPDPVVLSCEPDSASPNERLTVTVSGSNFQDGAVVDFGERVTVQEVNFYNSGTLYVKIKVHPRASTGSRDVTVTNPDGQSGTLIEGFLVN